MNFEEPSSEWDGLDALLAAKPIDLNGVRDSEFFGGGGGAQRMSFYMSPPKEAQRASSKYDHRPNVPSFSNKENRANNAFIAEPKEAIKPTTTMATKYTQQAKPKISEAVNEESPLPASYTTPSYPSSSSSSSSSSFAYSTIPSSLTSSLDRPITRTPSSSSIDKSSALQEKPLSSTIDKPLPQRTPLYPSSSYDKPSASSTSSLTASLEKPPSYPSKEDKPPAYPTTKELPPAYPEPQTPSSLSSSLPRASNLVKPRSKSSALQAYVPASTPSSSSSLTSSFTSTPASTPASTPLSTPLPTPPTPKRTSVTINKQNPQSYLMVSELSTPARSSSSASSASISTSKESKMDEMLRRISRLEEENKQLRETVEQSNSEKRALSQQVTSLEEELHTFMRQVQMVLLDK